MGRSQLREYLLLEILFAIVFYPTRRQAYRIVVLAAMVYVAGRIFLTSEVTDPNVSYILGNRVALRFVFTVYILCTGGEFPDHWRRVRDEVNAGSGTDGSKNLPSNFPFARKLWWMVELAYNFRMVGWVQEPRDHLPPHPPPSRLTFVRNAFLKLIVNIVVLDLVTLLYAQNPAFDSRLHDPTDGPETYLAALPLLHRVPYAVGSVVRLAASVSVIWDTFGSVPVVLGVWSPTLWPNIWGSWRDAYTVRRLWGRTWHQILRPMLSGVGKFVANDILKFPRGTILSAYTQLYVGFLMSGIIHSLGDYLAERRVVLRSIKYFLLHAMAITFEDIVIYVAKRSLLLVGIKLTPEKLDGTRVGAIVRVIGYCWVILWFSWASPILQDGLSALGFNTMDRKPLAQFLFNAWERWHQQGVGL